MQNNIAQFWKLLNVSQPLKCPKALRQAYLRQVLIVHPDVSAQHTGEKFRALTQAYTFLHSLLIETQKKTSSPNIPSVHVNRLFNAGWSSWEGVSETARSLEIVEKQQKEVLSDLATLITQDAFQIQINRGKEFSLLFEKFHQLKAAESQQVLEWNSALLTILRSVVPKVIPVLRKVILSREENSLPKYPKPLLILGAVCMALPSKIHASDETDITRKILLSHEATRETHFAESSLSAEALKSLETQTIEYWNLQHRVAKALQIFDLVFRKLPIACLLDWKSHSLLQMRHTVDLLEIAAAGFILGTQDKRQRSTDQEMIPHKNIPKTIKKLRRRKTIISKICILFRSPFLKEIVLREDKQGVHAKALATGGSCLISADEAHRIHPELDDTSFTTFKIVRCGLSSLNTGKLRVFIRLSKTHKVLLRRMYAAARAFARVVIAQEKAYAQIYAIKHNLPQALRRAFIRFFFFTIADEVLFWERLAACPFRDFIHQQGCDVYRHRDGVLNHITDIPVPSKMAFHSELWWHEPVKGRTDCPSVVLDENVLSTQEKFNEWIQFVLFSTLSYAQFESFRRRHRLHTSIRRGAFSISADQMYAFCGNYQAAVCRSVLERQARGNVPTVRLMPSNSHVSVNSVGEICIPWNATISELSAVLPREKSSKALLNE